VTTTVADIRATIVDTIKALVPTGITTPRFTPWQEDTLRTSFRLWSEKNPLAAFRRFSVRVLPGVEPAGVHDYNRRREVARLECVVAYPADHRYGALGAVSLDTILAADMALIVRLLDPDPALVAALPAAAVVTDEGHTVEDLEACRFGVATFTCEFYRSTT